MQLCVRVSVTTLASTSFVSTFLGFYRFLTHEFSLFILLPLLPLLPHDGKSAKPHFWQTMKVTVTAIQSSFLRQHKVIKLLKSLTGCQTLPGIRANEV